MTTQRQIDIAQLGDRIAALTLAQAREVLAYIKSLGGPDSAGVAVKPKPKPRQPAAAAKCIVALLLCALLVGCKPKEQISVNANPNQAPRTNLRVGSTYYEGVAIEETETNNGITIVMFRDAQGSRHWARSTHVDIEYLGAEAAP